MFRFKFASVLLLMLISSRTVSVGQDDVGPLNPEETQALEQITERRVRETVGFLASDEMAGRDTPSRELEIASAYVASRFQAAGLAGPSSTDSFYQTKMLDLMRPPASLSVENAETGQSIPGVTALAGAVDSVDVSGAPESVDGQPAQQASILVLDSMTVPPQAADRPDFILAVLARRLSPAFRAKAGCVLIRDDRDGPFFRAARKMETAPVQVSERFPIECPLLIVPRDTPLPERIQIKVGARRIEQTPVHNVIGVLKGSHPELSQQAVIVSAHLDHIGVRDGGEDRINNGADDNATGVTAVLSLADAYTSLPEPPARTIIFMTFWGEEKGLLGSKYYASHPTWPLDQVVANINIEMVGRPAEGAEEKCWMTGWKHSDLGELVAVGAKRAGLEVFHHEQFSEMLYTRSDNYSFVTAGVIAHSFSAGSLHDDYHQPGDEVEKLNITHMTSVIRGLFAGSLPILEGQLTPKATP